MRYKIIESKIKVCSFEELDENQQSLIAAAKEEVKKSYAPYSKFHVGAAVELENGVVVTGNNQENLAFPSGLCAERVALFYANSQYPDVPVKTIAVAAYGKDHYVSKPISPCGACRQVLLESEYRFKKDITMLLYGTEYVYVIENIKDLLPIAFELNCEK